MAGVKKISNKSKSPRYTVKLVYHKNKKTLSDLLIIASRTNRSYSSIMCELAENFVTKNQKIINQ